ncbi:penicillin-binding protein 2 [Desulfobacterium sp. N47]|uniref:Penicillin-binding protein 2 n=1 Tax=uncultured Desulfobacterium sp. TaxID=201089 RepID=E1YLG1_9BACT|nr:hypothetical protein N47_E44560 [uncultured Desulfobacterium sp.]
MDNLLRSTDNKWFRHRLSVVTYFVTVAFALLFLRLFYLQIIEGTDYRQLSENNCIRSQNIEYSRGMLLDRNGVLLVDNRPSFNLSVVLSNAKPLELTITKLSKYINVPAEDLMQQVSGIKGISCYKPFVLKQDIGRDILAAIEAHKYDLPGISVDVQPKRFYMQGNRAAHLIGYLSEISANELKNEKYSENKPGEYIGKFGIEKTFEKYLTGKRGVRQVEVNAVGQVIRVLNTADAEAGDNIYLTIDERLQRKAEELLENKAGAVVAMEPYSGEILAMASSPSFDPNLFVSGMTHDEWNNLISHPQRPIENKAIMGTYPPASTYKIITALAALEEKIIDKNTTFYCPGYLAHGNRKYMCWKKGGHGRVNVVKALAESCDVFFYNIGQRLDIDKLERYAKSCGLGSSTGIDLEHEGSGLIPSSKWKKKRFGYSWSSGESLSAVIGQGYNLVTPIQLLVLISEIANGGNKIKPLVVKKIINPEGKVILESKPENLGRISASQSTIDIIREGLCDVVNKNYGTAYRSRIDGGIEMCGKTGTAQVVGRKKDESNYDKKIIPYLHKSHALFVCYSPAANPKIAVAVVIEHGEHGATTAAPIAKELIQTFLNPINEEDQTSSDEAVKYKQVYD